MHWMLCVVQGLHGRRLHTVAMQVQRPLTDQEGLVYTLELQASHALPNTLQLPEMAGEHLLDCMLHSCVFTSC